MDIGSVKEKVNKNLRKISNGTTDIKNTSSETKPLHAGCEITCTGGCHSMCMACGGNTATPIMAPGVYMVRRD